MEKLILLRQKYVGRFEKWQDKRIEQMGFINNLLIGLSSLLLFWLIEGGLEGKLVQLHLISSWTAIIAGVCLLLSLLCGLLLARNRLSDFQKTVNLIRMESDRAAYLEFRNETKAKEKEDEIKENKEKIRKIGRWTWFLINAQGILFLLGLLILGGSVLLKINGF